MVFGTIIDAIIAGMSEKTGMPGENNLPSTSKFFQTRIYPEWDSNLDNERRCVPLVCALDYLVTEAPLLSYYMYITSVSWNVMF